jgi:hypothetical protein
VRVNWPITGAIDCDLHPAAPSEGALSPHLDEYWREMSVLRQLDRMGLMSYPPNARNFGLWDKDRGAIFREIALSLLRLNAT